VVRAVALLPSPVTGCYSAVLGIFHFFMEGVGKKRKRVVLTIKAKLDLSMGLLSTLRYILSIIF
jgi:hypothetical protein